MPHCRKSQRRQSGLYTPLTLALPPGPFLFSFTHLVGRFKHRFGIVRLPSRVATRNAWIPADPCPGSQLGTKHATPRSQSQRRAGVVVAGVVTQPCFTLPSGTLGHVGCRPQTTQRDWRLRSGGSARPISWVNGRLQCWRHPSSAALSAVSKECRGCTGRGPAVYGTKLVDG